MLQHKNYVFQSDIDFVVYIAFIRMSCEHVQMFHKFAGQTAHLYINPANGPAKYNINNKSMVKLKSTRNSWFPCRMESLLSSAR